MASGPSQPLSITFHECLGAGAFGEVYRATATRPPEPPRVVAVKVLRMERHQQREAVSRLLDEAKMLAALDHPAILRFHEATRVEGRVALVTEFVDGVDLSAFERPGPELPVRTLLLLLADVASALDCVLTTRSAQTGNPLGLIHRDVKPQNIRVSSRGQVKLLDFGVARTSELARETKTWAGDVLCTPGYASPEVLCGDVAGPPADVYALGITLFRVLARAPFHERHDVMGQRNSVLLRERYEVKLSARLATLGVDPEVEALLREMLAHDHAARPSAARVEQELRRIAARLEGPELAAWAATLKPEPVQDVVGDLVGRTVTEAPMSAVPTATPAPMAAMRAPPGLPSELSYGSGGTPMYTPTPAPVAQAPGPEASGIGIAGLAAAVALVLVLVLVGGAWWWFAP